MVREVLTMPTLLGTLEAKLLGLLAPLTAAQGGPLKTIEVEEFKSEEQLAELVERFRPRMPMGFLSVPSGQLSKANGPRVLDATFEYRFLAGIETRRSTESRRQIAYELFDQFAALTSLRQIGRQGLQTTADPDFVNLALLDYADSTDFAALLIGFSVTVRNWQINQPA
jgi:hypothetical protein